MDYLKSIILETLWFHDLSLKLFQKFRADGLTSTDLICSISL